MCNLNCPKFRIAETRDRKIAGLSKTVALELGGTDFPCSSSAPDFPQEMADKKWFFWFLILGEIHYKSLVNIYITMENHHL